ncbi:MAG: asparagine synthase (glutamine-hydrolyzing) [Victivallaceae bacterium]|nr:asparagine synthase (glutamine-hydrolyzing) [Victivallaceae bacterium]
MCGIAGIYGVCDKETVDRMVEVQSRRGPDGRGVWSDQEIPVTLGHCRLSILDLSSQGNQPMSYADGRLWITYNGEVYNFKELRTELEKLGHHFHSNSDTEVILAAYCEWGSECVKKFRGMFAFAIIDRCPRNGAPQLFLARDRLGIKPLLYFDNRSEFCFASELRALLASGRIDKKIDPEALLDYLAVGSVFQPRTIIKGVKTVPAAHWMEVRGHERKLVKYWDLHEDTAGLRKELQDIPFAEASLRLKSILQNAARYNMVSDVPVGAFLSGGIDSTAVVGFMGAVSGHKIKTFSVGFENKHRAIDERGYARIAAGYLGSDHQEVVVTSDEAAKIFTNVVADIDQPSFDGINTWIVSRATSRSVKVAVSGLGGDEIFAGYPHFRRLAEDSGAPFDKFPVIYNILEKAHKLRPNFLTLRLLSKFSKPVERLSALRRILENFEIEDDVRPEFNRLFRKRIVERYERWMLSDADEIQQTSYAEVNAYLQSTLLRDSDVMSMAHSLELRPMLLDHHLVEFAYALPPEYKLKEKETKRIFVDAASEYLPEELKTRSKMGFEMPLSEWMADELQERFTALLHSDNAGLLFKPAYLKRNINLLRRGNPPRALWAWGILLSWLNENKVTLE